VVWYVGFNVGTESTAVFMIFETRLIVLWLYSRKRHVFN